MSQVGRLRRVRVVQAGTWNVRPWQRRTSGHSSIIHGGGLDLVFPHHENEIAQSRAASDPFANYWLHNAWVTTAGEKMSKSLGNSLIVSQVLTKVRPVELRWYSIAATTAATSSSLTKPWPRRPLVIAESRVRDAGSITSWNCYGTILWPAATGVR